MARTCSSCGGSLSAYNSDPICGPCQRLSSAQGPRWTWDSETFRAALATGKPGQALAHIRASAGLSQADFASLLGWETSSYTRAERGQSQTLYDIRVLFKVFSALGVPREGLLPLLLGYPEPDLPAGLAKGDSDMKRRTLGAAALGAGLAFTVAEAPLASAAAPGRVGTIGSAHIAFLRAQAEKIKIGNQQFGAEALLRPAIQAYQQARHLLEYGEASSAIGASLASAVADMAETAAFLAYDSNQQDAARHMLREGLVFAEQGDDDNQTVRILATMVRQSCHLAKERPGLVREALQLTDRAAAVSRTMPMSTIMHAHLATREAISQAAAGDQRAFERAMRAAYREADRGLTLGDGDPAFFGYLTIWEIQAHEAKGYRYLGQPAQAVKILREVTTDPRPMLPLYGTLYQTYLAGALAESGDTIGAIEEGLNALGKLEQQVRSPRLLGELAPVRAVTAKSTTAGAQEFTRRFDALAHS